MLTLGILIRYDCSSVYYLKPKHFLELHNVQVALNTFFKLLPQTVAIAGNYTCLDSKELNLRIFVNV